MKNPKINPYVAVLVIFGVSVSFLFVENSLATEKAKTPPKIYSQSECLRCHSDEKTIKKMQDKAGDKSYFEAAGALYRKFHHPALR